MKKSSKIHGCEFIMDRDPKFLIVSNTRYTRNIDSPNLILFNQDGELILRDKEVLLNKLDASVEILRFPEYFQLLSSEKYSWSVYITTERLICAKNLAKISGAFELMDHIDNNGVLAVIDPTNAINLDQMFKIVNRKKSEARNFTMAFQLAYTRISSISVAKIEDPKTFEPISGGIELWYKDSINASDSQIIVYPENLSFEKPYDHALMIHKNALDEKLRCANRRKEVDPNFTKGDFATWKSTLTRLIQKPDMLAQGSGTLGVESWDPLIFQTHPVQWLSDVFARSLDASDRVNTSM